MTSDGNWYGPPEQQAAVVRDHTTGRLFESYQALSRWRFRHGIPANGSSSTTPDPSDNRQVYGPDAPAPQELPSR